MNCPNDQSPSQPSNFKPQPMYSPSQPRSPTPKEPDSLTPIPFNPSHKHKKGLHGKLDWKQFGYTNVQLAIGVLVSVVALLGAINGYTYLNQAKVNNEISLLVSLRASTSRLIATQGLSVTSGPSISTLANLGFFPNNLVTGIGTAGATVSNPWGGSITVAAARGDGVAVDATRPSDSMAFTSTNIPDAACRILGVSLDAVVSALKIGATSIKTTLAPTSSPATVGTNCTGNANILIYTISG